MSLATTAPERDPALPNLPTIAQSGLADYDLRLWFGLTAPKGTPRAIIDRLATATKQTLESEDARQKLAGAGYATRPGTPEEFGAFYRSEAAKWAKVVETVGSLGD